MGIKYSIILVNA